jgi:large subunit ribosomal protein L4
VAWGPKPRDYTTHMNAKARMRALCGALTARAQDGGVIIVDAPSLDEPKTKTMAELIQKIGLDTKKVLWVFDKMDEKALKSTRNLAKVKTAESRTLHTYALMNCDCLLLTEGGLKSLTERVNA